MTLKKTMQRIMGLEGIARDRVGGVAYLESWLTSTESTSTCRLFAEGEEVGMREFIGSAKGINIM